MKPLLLIVAALAGAASCPAAPLQLPTAPPVFSVGGLPPLEQPRQQPSLGLTVEPRPAGGSDFIKSLLLPGWGQFTQGRNAWGAGFLAAEAAFISGWIGLRTYAGWLEEDYKSIARQHAGVAGSHDHAFYVDIGNWQNEREFNEARIRDRWFDRMYLGLDDRWQWDRDESRLRFKEVRLASDQARQNSVMLVGALLLNHLFSAIDAARGQGRSARLSLSGSPHPAVTASYRW